MYSDFDADEDVYITTVGPWSQTIISSIVCYTIPVGFYSLHIQHNAVFNNYIDLNN